MPNYYKLCCHNIGKPVSIRTVDGQEHRGVIRQVTPTHVYIEPLSNQPQGFGTPYYEYVQPVQPYYPYRPGFGLGIAFGVIGTLAVLPWFFI